VVVAYIGLGSNLGDPQWQVTQALAELAVLPRSRLLARSSLYRSEPLGPPDQPQYINAVAVLETSLSADELLEALQHLEAEHGRQRGGERWGPRTLDLDLLLYGDQCLASARLHVPHPGLCERNFVLYPLAEIAPNLVIPGQGALAALLARCEASGLEKLEP
jgi:2-amino-4-hydroxy-6-hydroxymethyldihydropteridine diphosphokinase